jgi:hypothetical protein
MGERADIVKLDDLTGPPGTAGVGALLMADPAPQRDEFGPPVPTAVLVRRAKPDPWAPGRRRRSPAGVGEQREGNQDVEVDPRCQRVPETVERYAREWWSHQSGI